MVLENPLRRGTVSAIIALVALASFSPTAVAEQKSVILVQIDSPESANVRVQQLRTADDASAFRQSLDALFGNGDGTLSANETKRIRDATATDLRNKSLPLMSLDGTPASIVEPRVHFADAEGPVDNGGPLGIEHNLTVALEPDVDAESHTIVFSPPHDGVLTVKLPDEWTLDEARNLTDARTTEDGKIGGKVTAGSNVTLLVSTADEGLGGPGGIGDEAASWVGQREVLTVFAPFVVLAGVVGAFLHKRGNGDRRRRGSHPLDDDDGDASGHLDGSRRR